MDPKANQEEQARIEEKIQAGTATEEDKDRLEELKEALRDWKNKGGF